MRILSKQLREGVIRLKPENMDDLWELTHLVEEGNHVRASTERKIAVGGNKDKQVRKRMTLTLAVVDVSFEHETLRINGTIQAGPEDLISFGDHHSFSITPGDELSIKRTWDSLSLERLKRAEEAPSTNTLIVTFDREHAVLAELNRRGYDIIVELKGDVAKKSLEGGTEDFWKKLSQVIVEQDERKHFTSIIAASPAFWNEYLTKALPAHINKRVVTANISSVGEAGIKEVLKRPEVSTTLEQDRTAQEEGYLNHLLQAIHEDKACYGMKECYEESKHGRIELLLVSMNKINETREEGTYEEIDEILEQVQGTGGTIHILEHSTKQLDSLGGIAGERRW